MLNKKQLEKPFFKIKEEGKQQPNLDKPFFKKETLKNESTKPKVKKIFFEEMEEGAKKIKAEDEKYKKSKEAKRKAQKEKRESIFNKIKSFFAQPEKSKNYTEQNNNSKEVKDDSLIILYEIIEIYKELYGKTEKEIMKP